jgi:triosephosphate isomerase (TIM)
MEEVIMRTPIIAGNWKMNTTVAEAVNLVNEMRPELDKIGGVEKIICPPFVSLSAVKGLLSGGSVKLGAQNLFYEEKGAYTGEISPIMLADLCEAVIIGHSERRQYFHESNEVVNKKIMAALKHGLKPVVCVGEKLEENEAGRTEEVIVSQLRFSLAGVKNTSSLTVAYEPIWAIGTGRAATGQQANDTIGLIRHTLASIYDQTAAQSIRILYGGSVTEENTTELMSQPEIDGALVGGASLKAAKFVSIVQQTAQTKHSR